MGWWKDPWSRSQTRGFHRITCQTCAMNESLMVYAMVSVTGTHTQKKPTVEAIRRKNLSVSSKDWTLGLLPRRPEGFSRLRPFPPAWATSSGRESGRQGQPAGRPLTEHHVLGSLTAYPLSNSQPSSVSSPPSLYLPLRLGCFTVPVCQHRPLLAMDLTGFALTLSPKPLSISEP